MKKLTLLLTSLLATTLFAGGSTQEINKLVPQSMRPLLQELPFPIPDQITIEKATENDPISFFKYLNQNFAPEYAQNIDSFVNKYKEIVTSLLKKILVYKDKDLSPKEAAERLRYEIIANTYGFDLYDNGYALGRSNQAWINVSGTTPKDAEKLWECGIYGSYQKSQVTAEIKSNCRNALIGEYKIHLMPIDEQREKTTILLFKSLKENPEIKALIPVTKTLVSAESFIKEKQLPKFVIYVTGKDAAEKVLAWTYKTFKNIKGCGFGPQFNEKVTDLIYFAQGNRDDKKTAVKNNSWGEKIFEEPNMVYYNELFTGKKQDYHLKNPAVMAPKDIFDYEAKNKKLPEIDGIKQTDLRGVNMSGWDLSGHDLSGADLTGSDLSNIKFDDKSQPKFKDTNVSGVNFKGAKERSGSGKHQVYGPLSKEDLKRWGALNVDKALNIK